MMSKFDKHLEQHPELASPRISRTALRHALELDFLMHPWRFCLRLVLRFVKGWAITQLFGWAGLGVLLLLCLLLNPAAFAAQVHTARLVNEWSLLAAHALWLFADVYGVFAGTFLMVFGTLAAGEKQARNLAEQRGFMYE